VGFFVRVRIFLRGEDKGEDKGEELKGWMC
jgi:hypothetical protein